MNQQQAKDFWPLIKAWSEGEELQMNRGNILDPAWWYADNCYGFTLPFENYRIKPKPTLRPWKTKEVPVGALARKKDGTVRTMICTATSAGTNLGEPEVALAHYEHSLDHGKTWLPCGVEE